MALSILYLDKNNSRTKPLSDRMLYRLSLDRSFSHICIDSNYRNTFFSVVSNLTDNPEEALYRQEIIKDFQRNSDLLDQLISLSSRFEELQLSQKSAGKDKYRLSISGTASLTSSKNILQVQALCLKRALLFIKAYGELLSNYNLTSNGLNALCDACKEIYSGPDFLKLLAFCTKYESFSSSGFRDFKYALTDEGCFKEYELIDHRYIHVTDPELKKKSFSFFKKAEETSYPCERLFPGKDDLFDNLAISALTDLSSLFAKISEQIFEKFGLLGRELIFYDVSLKYIRALSEKNVPMRYPVFTSDKSIKIKTLYDLYLLMSKPDPSAVIPNDFTLKSNSRGLLVFGDNGSGKTVYLRSVATALILSHAGLPLPCESAEITLFSQLTTQFSEAEKEFCEGNDAGRFEQEVRELSAMVDTLEEGALVFLNETFQSTAYAEGAEGLYHLLEHFSCLGIRWILVTHLRQIEKMFDDKGIDIFHTKKGYKIL